tara:strand:- start:260 stop:1318 length:1059 start_codon:yes stop_codon:yes gene_type:complete
MGLTSNTGLYNAAADHFGADDPVTLRQPRQKFNFSLEFILNGNIPLIDDSYGRSFTFNRVLTAGLPDFDYSIQRLNQYNRPRFVPTRLETGPANFSFYDTKDNQFLHLMMGYAGHYFHGHQLDPRNFSGNNIIQEQFSTGAGQPFGAETITHDTRFMFEEIKLHQKDTAQGGKTTTMFNCMITSVSYDTLDYADSQPVMWSVQFQPEHVNFDPLGGTAPESSVNVEQAARQQVETGNTTASAIGSRLATNKFNESVSTLEQMYTPNSEVVNRGINLMTRGIDQDGFAYTEITPPTNIFPNIRDFGRPVEMPTLGDGTTPNVDPGIEIPNNSSNETPATQLNNGTITFAAGPQ